MAKKISVTELRTQLAGLLDQLGEGQSHFVIERNNQEAAVLLSIEKFREIMQMLELFNTLEFIETGSNHETMELTNDFPELQIIRPTHDSELAAGKDSAHPPTSRNHHGQAIEAAAAKLGIRLIK